MSRQAVNRLAWGCLVISIVLYFVLEALALMTPTESVPAALRSQVGLAQHLFNWSFLPFVIVGALVASRRPQNAVGWLLCALGLGIIAAGLAKTYALYALFVHPGLPGAAWSAWLASWLWLVGSGLVLAPLPLLFPDGRLPSPRWGVVIWFSAVAMGLTIIVGALDPGYLTDYGVRNPTGFSGAKGAMQLARNLGFVALAITPVLSTLGVTVRYRRGDAEQRQQIKWFAAAVALQAAVLVLETIAFVGSGIQPYRLPIVNFITAAALSTLPVSIGIAVLKYRLYDIDLVINRSLVFGMLALFIAGVYVGVVAGLGALIGGGGRPNLALSIAATAFVAVAFQPVRERVERLANRLVYGKRATPYEVLSQFSDRVAGTYASEDVLPRMAQVLAEGTGAARADVWLRISDHIASAASWPAKDGPAPESVALTGQLLPPMPAVTRALPVRHQGELLGALTIKKRPGEAVTPVEDDLLKNLAAQAGLVLRNVRLTAELRARLEEISKQAAELRASRQRIVAAQDAERRRLERNIHDGAQQNLVALTVKVRLATTLAKREPERARVSVKELAAESDRALETLRALARGIYPQLLREQGLAAAVGAEAATMPIPATVRADHLDRYRPEVEAAVYFVCMEALQNVTKHARASHLQVSLRADAHELSFAVTDDGTGFEVAKDAGGSGLRNMTDRIEGIGGRLVIRSEANQGTTVSGTVPVGATEAVP